MRLPLRPLRNDVLLTAVIMAYKKFYLNDNGLKSKEVKAYLEHAIKLVWGEAGFEGWINSVQKKGEK